MARLLGVNIPDKKRGEIALTYIYGLGRSFAKTIIAQAKVDPNKCVDAWTDKDFQTIRTIISEKYKIEGDLRSIVRLNIKRLMDIGCYRGKRHRAGLPTRGQRTRVNARTRKGKPKTIAGKKKATK